MEKWIEFSFLLKNPYERISKGSIVKIDGVEHVVKRIDGIVLLNEAVKEPSTVHVHARGIRRV